MAGKTYKNYLVGTHKDQWTKSVLPDTILRQRISKEYIHGGENPFEKGAPVKGTTKIIASIYNDRKTSLTVRSNIRATVAFRQLLETASYSPRHIVGLEEVFSLVG